MTADRDGPPPAPVASPSEVVKHVRAGFDDGLLRDLAARKAQLHQLRRLLVEQEDRLLAALAADMGKPPVEGYAADIGFTTREITHLLAHLDRWVRPRSVRVPAVTRPGRAQVRPEPLGVALVIAPWNYPVQLLLAPAAAALAAGNAVVLKPSEISAHTAEALAELVPRYLDERVVAIVTGGVDETTALLGERFDHIFYTGNGRVGRVVMAAAAAHLTPVTLELGGKSPAIVAADAHVEVAARRIAWAKFLNAGQTCVAPDYVLVDRAVEASLLRALAEAVGAFYGPDPRRSRDFARIVNEPHFARLAGLLDAGGFREVVVGGERDRATRYLAPTVLAGVDPGAAVMGEEIFGPILPVLAVDDVDEAVTFVNQRDKPLALYVFGGQAATDRVVERTSAGGVCVNHAVLQVAVPELPFGGVGESGIGAYHGRAGFERFSHLKPVLSKPARPDPPVLYPPYSRLKRWLLRRAM
jgi:aldehyde dehydrogenase (NAD+)